uniref:Transmembrane 7 superfamily member 3-like n=1 Tax=Petromyzon marinus TaxID=7757 RepID=A0AAJ7UEQ0_PETMA|nr:transmembrane 7 superfamily member 3-like [Petromyzon marinus]
MWGSPLLLLSLSAILHLASGSQSPHTADDDVRSDVRMELRLGVNRVERLSTNETLVLSVEALPNSASFVTFQAHERGDGAVTVAFSRALGRGNSYTGTDAGLLFPLHPRDSRLLWYMYTGTQANATASLLALAYSDSDPVPGGCNLEYDMEVDPNLRLSYNLYETVLEFAPANLGYPRGSVPPACDQDKGPESRWRLEYDVYQTFLEEGDLGVDSLLSALRRLSSASGCEAFGSKMRTLSSSEKPRLVQTSYPGQGVVYCVVVRDPRRNTSAAYVPAATYACSFSAHSDGCYHLGKTYYKVLMVLAGLVGLFMSFFGHRFFKTQVFLDGFSLGCLAVYVVVTRVTVHTAIHTSVHTTADLGDAARVAISCSAGVVAGLLLLALWWRLGLCTVCVLASGTLLGFVLASAAFFSPLGDLRLFQSDVNFWMCFTCGTLFVPIMLLLCPFVLSVVACAVLGGYAVVLACAVFVRSSLPYLLLNTVRRAALKDYTRVYNAAPFQTNDYVLASVWASLALAGTLFQARRGWGLPTFPPCPYEEWLYNAERRSTNVLDPSHHRPSARGRACRALASACAAMRRPGKRRDDDGEGGGGGGGCGGGGGGGDDYDGRLGRERGGVGERTPLLVNK